MTRSAHTQAGTGQPHRRALPKRATRTRGATVEILEPRCLLAGGANAVMVQDVYVGETPGPSVMI